MEPFQIIVTVEKETYRLTITQHEITDEIEQYEARANNHIIQLDCNRPKLAKENYEHGPWDWRLISKPIPKLFLEELISAIQKEVKIYYWKLKH